MAHILNNAVLNRSRLRFARLSEHIRAILDTVREPFVVLDGSLRIRLVNKAFCRFAVLTPKEINGRRVDELGDGEWKIPALHTWLEEILASPSETRDFQLDRLFPKLGHKTLLLHARRVEIAGVSRKIILLTIEDMTQRRQAQHSMEEQNHSLKTDSMTDELTGLYNRRGFSVLGQQYLELAQRRRKRIFVLFVDLDGLKQINDQGGHAEGDHTLIRTAEILKQTFRKSDILARLGGDEFAIATMENGHDSAAIQMARLQVNLQRHAAQNGHHTPISLSVGVAHSDPRKPCSIEELISQADALMYVEKRKKRNTPTARRPSAASVN